MDDYTKALDNYLAAVSYSRLLTMVVQYALKNYPRAYPPQLQRAVDDKLKQLTKELKKLEKHEDPGRKRVLGHTLKALSRLFNDLMSSGAVRILDPAERLHAERLIEKSHRPSLDPVRMILSQELAMLFAYLDVFMAETIRTMCRIRPDLMKTGKQIEWETVISCGDWQNLLRYLTDEYVAEFARKSIREQTQWLLKRGVKFHSDEQTLIEEAENVRHIVIHNNGIVDREFLGRTRRTDLSDGTPFPLTPEYVEKVSEATTKFAEALFEAVFATFLNKTPLADHADLETK